MLSIPSAAGPILMSSSAAFTKPTFQRVIALAVGAIVTMGRRTVTGILCTMRGLTSGDCSSYHRVFSQAVWSLWPLGKVLSEAILPKRWVVERTFAWLGKYRRLSRDCESLPVSSEAMI